MSKKSQTTLKVSVENQMKAGLNDCMNELGKFGKTVENLKKLTIGAGIGTALYKIGESAKACVSNFMETEDAYLRMARALGKEDYNKAIKSIDRFGKYTKASRDELAAMMSTMASMGKSTAEMDKITEAAIALSNVTGKDLSSSFEIMLDSLNGSTGEMEKFLPQVRDMSTEMKAAGGAIDEVINKFGGLSKEIAGESFSQTVSNIKKSMDSIGESIGAILSNALGPIFEWIDERLDELDNRLKRARGSLTRDMNAREVIEHKIWDTTDLEDLKYLRDKFEEELKYNKEDYVLKRKAINLLEKEISNRDYTVNLSEALYKGIKFEDLNPDTKQPYTPEEWLDMFFKGAYIETPNESNLETDYAEYISKFSYLSIDEIEKTMEEIHKNIEYSFQVLNDALIAGDTATAGKRAEMIMKDDALGRFAEQLWNKVMATNPARFTEPGYYPADGEYPLFDQPSKFEIAASAAEEAAKEAELAAQAAAKAAEEAALKAASSLGTSLNNGAGMTELLSVKEMWDLGHPLKFEIPEKPEEKTYWDVIKETDNLLKGFSQFLDPQNIAEELQYYEDQRELVQAQLDELKTFAKGNSKRENDLLKVLDGIDKKTADIIKEAAEERKANREHNLVNDLPELWNKVNGEESLENGIMGSLMDSFEGLFQAIQPIMSMIQNPIWTMIAEIFEGFVSVIAPAITQTIQPFFDALAWIGETIGNLFMPIFDSLYPYFTLIAQILETIIAPVLQLIAPFMEIVALILDAIRPILVAVAVAFEYLMAPVKWLADLFKWFGDWISYAGHCIDTFVWNLAHPFRKRGYGSGPGGFHSDAFSGLNDRIAKLTELNAQDNAISGNVTSTDTAIQSANYNGAMTVTINNNFYAPVVGEDGMDQFATMIKDKFVELDYFGV